MSRFKILFIALAGAIVVFGILMVRDGQKQYAHAASKDAQIGAVEQSLTPEKVERWQPPTDLIRQNLTNADIIKLSEAHVSDDVIIAAIQSRAGSFDTTPDDLLALKKAGVSDKVVIVLVKDYEGADTPDPGK
jgi:hypothetical protein